MDVGETNSSWQPNASIATLKHRAAIVRQIREWFFKRDILEVETPQLVTGATTDPHIDSFQLAGNPLRSLRTSSEFHQKRLLAAGSGDIYELGKVFRVDETGRYHNPEFTMLEWYRGGLTHHQLIDEVEQFLAYLHVTDFPGFERISYRELWFKYAGIDVATNDTSALAAFIESVGCEVPRVINKDFDALLDLGMAAVIADCLAQDTYTCIYNYPASQASLAKIDRSDAEFPVASRFEIYYGAVELANGYHELTDAAEQQTRFEQDNQHRILNAKTEMPIDHYLIDALHHGLPDCAGVALGLDRLMMILVPDISAINQTLSFDWVRA